jgi:hypothetical protein
VGNDAITYSSLGEATIGINNASGALSYYANGWGGNRYTTIIGDVSEFTEPLSGPLTGVGVLVDAANPNVSWGQWGANTAVAGTAWYIGGLPGAVLGGSYFVGGLIQAPVNNAVEGTFQIFTDTYYGNYNSSDYPEPIVMPPPN